MKKVRADIIYIAEYRKPYFGKWLTLDEIFKSKDEALRALLYEFEDSPFFKNIRTRVVAYVPLKPRGRKR